MMVRGGGCPTRIMASDAACETGPAAPELRRRCAWLHHGSGPIGPTAYKFVARPIAPKASSPRIVFCKPMPWFRAAAEKREMRTENT